MNLRESLRIGWRSIVGHKLRSTLTTLGVIIGIASVITFMILGGAFTADVVGDLDDENEPMMSVVTQTEPDAGTGVMHVQSPIYTESDVDRIESIDGVEWVAPTGSLSPVQLTHGDDSITGGFSAQATNPAPFEEDGLYPLEEGETFSTEDEAIVNLQAARLFDEELSADDEITVTFEDGSTENFAVAGVADVDLGGSSSNPTVYVPLDAHYTVTVETPRDTRERGYPSLLVKTESIEGLDSVQDDVEAYLESDSDAHELKADDHEIVAQTLDDLVEQISGIVDQLTIFIGGIAAISLLVGSIGIANIMIVSVTERTREIGIMKAIGARKRDIVQLFLVESVILGAIGAFFGVAFGIGLGYLLVSWIGWPMAYPLDWIVIAVGVGVGVGVVSGLYPAWRAAKTDPIEALRRE
ncbi:ABC transporter permease [Halobacteria archaeon AArc-m2/3/4]|uniref:ABC transporter permease n=1 Tax=Natronoglomus mannanivorans TaxID=2979990 RepID=A0ABT2QAY6_9EURY|nr:ABC transporter permease [Halobacteria archaeon AArc-m2/3/4]